MDPLNNVNNYDAQPLINGVSFETLNNYEYRSLNFNETKRIRCSYIFPNGIKSSNKNNLSILSANIRSMKTNFATFRAEILNSVNSIDILGFCESHLTDTSEKVYMLPNYNFFSTNVTNNKGGVCLYISNRVVSKIRADLCVKSDHLETVFADCVVNENVLTIGVIYHRPGTSETLFVHDLQTILEKVKTRCVLIGDFNENLLNESDDNNVRNFVLSIREYAYSPIITKPTRIMNNSISLLDQMWVNFDQPQGFHSNVIISGITDHFPTIFFYALPIKCETYKKITYRRKGEMCDNVFKDKLRDSNLGDILLIQNVNEAFDLFTNIVKNIYNEAYPFVTKHVKYNAVKNPWITSAIKTSINTKNKMYKKFVKYPITYGDSYKRYRNNLTKIIKAAKNRYYIHKFNQCNGDIKQTWRQINNIMGKDHDNVNTIFKINNNSTQDSIVIADAFNEYYSNIGVNTSNALRRPNRNFVDYLPRVNHPNINWTLTTEAEVKSIICKSKNCRAGPDEIPMAVLKSNVDILSPIISHMCNLSITSGIFPTIHKTGCVLPLYKSKERTLIENY